MEFQFLPKLHIGDDGDSDDEIDVDGGDVGGDGDSQDVVDCNDDGRW